MPDSFNDAPIPSFSMQIPKLPTGWQAIEHAILIDGTLAVLATDVDLKGEHQRIRAAFEKSAAPVPPSQLLTLSESGLARILIASPSGWVDGPTFPLETPFPLFDSFCDGRWLVVAARSRGEANARVISQAGLVLDRIMLGDGIEYVAVDTADRIWVGWFDEGMFGNDNWRVPGQEWPPSSNGVGCFKTDGGLMPIPKWPDGVGSIADCYALNVIGTGAWACPYTEFPLVYFSVEETVRWWRGNLIGPSGIAIDGSHALVVGGFREDANRIALVALDGAGNGEEARVLAKWALPLRRLPPSSQEWAPIWDNPTLLTGRGDTMHLVDNGNWFSWRVADFLAELKQ